MDHAINSLKTIIEALNRPGIKHVYVYGSLLRCASPNCGVFEEEVYLIRALKNGQFLVTPAVYFVKQVDQ